MKRLFLFLLTLCISMLSAMATTETIKTTALPETSDVFNQIGEDNLINVTKLIFEPGSTINSYDIMIIRNRMPNLTDLDMGEVTIVANKHEYYTGYHSQNDTLGAYAFYEVPNLENVVLPKSIKYIGSNAFSSNDMTYDYEKQSKLKTVRFPDGSIIKGIGSSAFANCRNLQSVNFPEGLATIEMSAFNGSGITSVTLLDGLISIGWNAFSGCSSLTSVSLPKTLKRIEGSAFSSCYNLSNITFHYDKEYNKAEDKKLIIGESAFSYCSSLSNIELPAHLIRIGSWAFRNCSGLQSINIPSSVMKIDQSAFGECSQLNDIYPQPITPIHIDQTTFSTYATANVHLTRQEDSANKYYWNTEWNQFLKLHTTPENPGEDNPDDDNTVNQFFYIPNDNDFTFSDGSSRINGQPDVDLYSGSGLTVEGEETQNLGDVHLMVEEIGYTSMGGGEIKSSSIIGNGNITAKKVYFDLSLQANCWYFMSFPFKVRISDIICKGNWIFRYYDSEARAKNGSGGWKNLPESEQFLYPGRGYIFQTDYYNSSMETGPSMTENDTKEPTIRIPIETENLDFSGEDKSNAVTSYPSSDASNASWNFMGNPYPSYFDLDEIDYDGPITVWNGMSYVSVRKGDDQYHFRPLEGFFVQKPEGVAAVKFLATGRHTLSQWAEIQAGKSMTRAAETRSAMSRQLIDLTISDGSNTDKTRVVFNPECAETYEIGTDACKFIAAKAAQLYSVDSKNVNYSINERSEGDVRLGYVAVKSGEMTISAGRMDTPVAIYDKEMGITFDLSKGAYQFSTEAGTFNDRFVLVRGGGATRINAINAEAAEDDAPVYTLGGQRVEQLKANRVYITNGKKVIKK